MKRRVYLSVAGGVLFSGCAALSPSAEAETPPPETPQTPTLTPAPTTVSTPSPTPEPTTESATPETPDEVDEDLAEIAADLAKVVEQYAAAAGDGAGFLGLRSTTRFSFDQNAANLYSARDLVYDVREEADETQQKRLARLWDGYKFLWWTGKSFERLGWAYHRSETAVSRFYAGDYRQIAAESDDIVSAVNEAEAMLASLKAESEASSLDAVDGLSSESYSKTVSHIEAEIPVFEAFAERIATLASLVLRLDDGLTAYLDENYDDAYRTFRNLSWEFEDARQNTVESPTTPAVRDPLDEIACMTSALANGCRYLADAATAGIEARPDAQTAQERHAEDKFERCSLVMVELEMLPAFFDALPQRM